MKATRKLNFSDTFRLARIIKAAGITAAELADLLSTRDKLQAEAKKDPSEAKKDPAAAQTEMGLALVSYIVDKVPDAEKQINGFLASLAGVKPEEIEKAAVPEIIELIKDIFEQNADIKDFFISGLRSAAVMPST